MRCHLHILFSCFALHKPPISPATCAQVRPRATRSASSFEKIRGTSNRKICSPFTRGSRASGCPAPGCLGTKLSGERSSHSSICSTPSPSTPQRLFLRLLIVDGLMGWRLRRSRARFTSCATTAFQLILRLIRCSSIAECKAAISNSVVGIGKSIQAEAVSPHMWHPTTV